MPSVQFNIGFTSWTPSANSVPNGTTVTFRAIGSGGDGSAGDYAINGGEGGGGGESAWDGYVISDNTESWNIQVAAGGSTDITYVETPAMTYLLVANPGGNGMTATPGLGGTGGTGAGGLYDGGDGAMGSGIDGGGGGGAAGDSSAGNNASGTSGGAGVTQFGSAGGGTGGAAGSNSGNGQIGTLYGGGGGGGGITGAGGEGVDGRVEASWTLAATNDSAWWYFFASLFGACTAHWPTLGSLTPHQLMLACRFKPWNSPLLYGTRREWRRLFERPKLMLPSQRMLIANMRDTPHGSLGWIMNAR